MERPQDNRTMRNLNESFRECAEEKGDKSGEKPAEKASGGGNPDNSGNGDGFGMTKGRTNSQTIAVDDSNKNMDDIMEETAQQTDQRKPSYSPGVESANSTMTWQQEFDGEEMADNQCDAREDLGGEFFEALETKRVNQLQQTVNEMRTVTGVQITRTMQGDSRWHTKDIRNIFQLLHSIDSDMIIMDCTGSLKSVKTVLSMTRLLRMDYNGYLDIQNIKWGKPSEGKTRTTLSFWIASNAIKKNLWEIRQDSNFQEFLMLGQCRIQSTKLYESQSKIIGLIEGKSPQHTNRMELEDKLSRHFSSHSVNRKQIAVNVVPFTENGTQILAMAVGNKDARAAETILTEKPFPTLGIIHYSWKRSHKDDYYQRIQQHRMVCQQSKAFKLESMDMEHAFPLFETFLRDSPASSAIVDICTAAHSNRTGTVYVQYLEAHSDTVRREILTFIEDRCNPPDSPFGEHARLVTVDGSTSVTPTVNSLKSGATKAATSIPTSRFADMLSSSSAAPLNLPPAAPAGVPKAITTKPKSFSHALMGTLADSDSDDDTTLTPRTKNSQGGSSGSGSGSKKTTTELEEDNQRLRGLLGHLNHRFTEMERSHQAQMAAMQKAHREQLTAQQKQMTDMAQALQHLRQQFDGTPQESPHRKQPPTKRSNTRPSPSKNPAQQQPTATTGWRSLLPGNANTVVQHLAEVVAPLPSTTDPMQPPTTPPAVGPGTHV